jgi:hypothetical protein
MNILISYHTDQHAMSEQLQTDLIEQHFSCYLINESIPQGLSSRSNLIRSCDVFIVIVHRIYQYTPYCMETINYAKDLRKPVIALLATENFQPYGALGAISASAILSLVVDGESISLDLLTQIVNTISSKVRKAKPNEGASVPSLVGLLMKIRVSYVSLIHRFGSLQMKDDDHSNMTLIRGDNMSKVLICTMSDALLVAQLIYAELISNGVNVALENLSEPNASCSAAHCSVFVPVLSPQFEQAWTCRAVFEEVRRCRIPFAPVMAIKKWKPEDWLGLIIAGSTFFRIFNKDSAYESFYDSNRMKDLCAEIEVNAKRMMSVDNSRCHRLMSDYFHV